MAIPLYLAMTPGEFQAAQTWPPHLAWMSCHFSPGGNGLSSFPRHLPPGSLLILDDQLPPNGHDPEFISEQLKQVLSTLDCCGLLLDFQRTEDNQTAQICKKLLELDYPVCVSSHYAHGLDCPVFLPPCPVTEPPDTYLAPWQGRDIWLEMSTGAVCAQVNKQGCHMTEAGGTDFPHADADLCCHYRIETTPEELRFHISRTEEDRNALIAQAEGLGVTKAIGLYQELGK